MLKYAKEVLINFSPSQLYNLVLDIEKYPEFLPWCNDAKILNKSKDTILADLTIKFLTYKEKYTSEVTFIPFKEINVFQRSGPFKYLENSWRFKEIENHSSIVSIELCCEFRSSVLNKLIDQYIDLAMTKIYQAFIDRAYFLYK